MNLDNICGNTLWPDREVSEWACFLPPKHFGYCANKHGWWWIDPRKDLAERSLVRVRRVAEDFASAWRQLPPGARDDVPYDLVRAYHDLDHELRRAAISDE